jgi:hypothetical protein
MGIHLPDDVRVALRDEGIGEDEALLMTGDDLRQAIGGQLTYDLAVALSGQGLAIARWSGRSGDLPQADLIERNLDILKLRIVDGLTYAAIGREVGLTNSRVSEILRTRFGVDAKDTRPPKVLRVQAADVPVLRAALLMRLRELGEGIEDADWSEVLGRMQEVMYLLREVEDDEDVEMHVGAKSRGPVVRQALEDYTRDRDVRDRLLAAMP